MYYSSCRSWLIYMGLFCIIAGIFGGLISVFYGPINLLLLFSLMFLNTLSFIGYIFLGIGLILQYFKVQLKKREDKYKPQTEKFGSFKEFVQKEKEGKIDKPENNY